MSAATPLEYFATTPNNSFALGPTKKETTTIMKIDRFQAHKHPEWRGPSLGPKPSEENKREFTEEQLRAGEGVIGLQAGNNKGATQAGQSFGATRKILLGK